ncbi:MAG: hypothetical protein MUC87_02795 [Bacteroidia bacterium]|jgi:hypothetical protein|nr:hypothetical protein [Bacteroidia bacterium]
MHIPDELVRLTMKSATWFVLVPFFTAIYAWFVKREMLPEQKMISAYIFLAVLTEIAADIMHKINPENNLPILHVYTLLQFLLIALLFRKFMQKPHQIQIWWVVTIVFLSGSIINSLFIQTIWKFNGYARAAESLIIVLFVVAYFFKLLFSEEAKMPLYGIPMFWISTALLFYFSACFFVFLLSGDVLIINSKVFTISWAFHDLILIIHYIFITAALWPTRQPTLYMSRSSQAH